jgi:hypothetical protein
MLNPENSQYYTKEPTLYMCKIFVCYQLVKNMNSTKFILLWQLWNKQELRFTKFYCHSFLFLKSLLWEKTQSNTKMAEF